MKQRQRVFLGCEGESERSYGRFLQSQADARQLSLHFESFDAKGGDPLSIVEKSIKRYKADERFKTAYKFKAVLLDKDKIGQNPGRDRLIDNLLRRNGIVAVFQQWEHEALLLRHFDKCAKLRPPKGKSFSVLRKVWPEYEKPMDSISLREKLTGQHLDRALSVEIDLSAFLKQLGF